jgi:hypothetical protein
MSAGVGLRRGSGVAALGTAKATVSVRAATTAAWRSVAATKGRAHASPALPTSRTLPFTQANLTSYSVKCGTVIVAPFKFRSSNCMV